MIQDIFRALPHQYDEGAYAYVFFSPPGRATKIFKRRQPSESGHVREVFESEVSAYEIASSVPALQRLTPAYYGKVAVRDVLDGQGRSIANLLFLDYAYQMDFVSGPFHKIGCMLPACYETLEGSFRTHGIFHTKDASVVLDETSNVLCVIDFAVREYELFHDDP